MPTVEKAHRLLLALYMHYSKHFAYFIFSCFLLISSCDSKTEVVQDIPKTDCSPSTIRLSDSLMATVFPELEPTTSKQAIALMQEAAVVDSTCMKINDNLLLLQSYQKDFVGMNITLRRLLRLQPNNPSHLSMLGLVEEQIGRPERSVAKYEKALSVYTQMLDSVSSSESAEGAAYLQFNQGLCRLLLGEEEEAHKLIQKVYEQVPDSNMKLVMSPFLSISREEYVDLIWTTNKP